MKLLNKKNCRNPFRSISGLSTFLHLRVKFQLKSRMTYHINVWFSSGGFQWAPTQLGLYSAENTVGNLNWMENNIGMKHVVV